MTERKFYYVAVSWSDLDVSAGHSFSAVVVAAKKATVSKPIRNDTPPPDRDVYLQLEYTEFDDLLKLNLEKIFGFVFHQNLLFADGNVKHKFLAQFRGIAKRLVNQNKDLKYFGVSCAVFAPGARLESRRDMLIGLDTVVPQTLPDIQVFTEVIPCKDAMEWFLEHELLRVAVGDIDYHRDRIY